MNLSAGNTKPLYRVLLGASIALLAAFAAAVPAFAWTDALTPGSTPIRKVHVDELRTAIAAKVVSFGFGSPSWTDPTLTAGATRIRAVHMTEMQGQLNLIPAYFNAWCPAVVPAAPAWDAAVAGSSLIRANNFLQLRNYHDSLGAASGCCPNCRYPAGTSACYPVGAGGADPYGRCPVGYTCYWNDKPLYYYDSYRTSCNGAGSCTSVFYETCNGGGAYCVGNDIYSRDGSCTAGGCNNAYSASCPTSGLLCAGAYQRNQYTGCSAGACASAYYDTCPSGLYCAGGSQRNQYTGCSAGNCNAAYYDNCNSALFCADGCNIYSGNSTCSGGACGGSFYMDCCTVTPGYCSGGACY